MPDIAAILANADPFDPEEQDAVEDAINALPYRRANPEWKSIAEKARAKFREQRAARSGERDESAGSV